MDPDAFSREKLLIHPADGREVEVALVVDVFHHEADLVAVTGEHDDGPFLALDQAEAIPEDVGLDVIRVFLNPVAENLLHRLFVAGRTGGFGQGSQKFKRFGAHTITSKFYGGVQIKYPKQRDLIKMGIELDETLQPWPAGTDESPA